MIDHGKAKQYAGFIASELIPIGEKTTNLALAYLELTTEHIALKNKFAGMDALVESYRTENARNKPSWIKAAFMRLAGL